MIAEITSKLPDVAALCRKHHVARLELFGSAADEKAFDPASSDVDFIVEFEQGTDLGPWLAGYFDLQDDLRVLLGRDVDLVMASAPSKPYFIHELNRTRRLVQAA